MPPEITLTIYDETGRERQARFRASRLTIGRLLENDLVIEDSNLALRHAVIENFDGEVLLSDCGTENGTLVNGIRVSRPVKLRDGDVLTLGGSTEITIQFDDAPSESVATCSTEKQTWYASRPVLVVLLAALLLTTLLSAILIVRRDGTQRDSSPGETNAERGNGPESSDESGTHASPSVPINQAGVAIDSPESSAPGTFNPEEIEKHALKVMREISNDPNPTVSREVVNRIGEKVKSYRGSSGLRDELRALNPRGMAQLDEAAKRSDIKLALVVYAALAKMESEHAGGDPLEVARGMLPTLARLRGIFSTELANDSLLIIAGYNEGQVGATHPLQTRIFELTRSQPDSPATIRTVWYLHEHNKLSAESYDLVLRFLAIGVVAQNPRRFGVDAQPPAL